MYHAICMSYLAKIGNLAVLSLLADLEDWKPIFFSGHKI